MFPDPARSPAHHARTLEIDLGEGDIEDGDWIQGFFRVERLFLSAIHTGVISFAPFYKLSPSLVYLHVYSDTIHPQVFDLIHSLPHLEDLTLTGDGILHDDGFDGPQTVVPPSTSPPLTGSLKIFLENGISSAARRLLNLPDGLHFREIRLGPSEEEELPLVSELVDACFDTLECLRITFLASCKLVSIPHFIDYALQFLKSASTAESVSSPIDLSKATKLEEAAFWCHSARIGWVVLTLKTITPGHRNFRLISIRLPSMLRRIIPSDAPLRIEAGSHGVEWSDLDLLLVQFWESHSIRPKIVCPWSRPVNSTRGAKDLVLYLLPESMKRGILDLVDSEELQLTSVLEL